MEDQSYLSDLIIELKDKEEKKQEKKENIEVNYNLENQLLAIISKKEYVCFALEFFYYNYLMFTDNEITYDLIKLNPNINVIENNQQKNINLILKKNFYQKSFDNITVTLVGYSGLIKKNHIIKYDYNSGEIKNCPILKDYKHHLKSLSNDIKKDKELERKKNDRRKEIIDCLAPTLCVLVCIALIVLGIIFPKFGMVELEILLEILGG